MLLKIISLHIICGFMRSPLSVVVADGGKEVEPSPKASWIENDASLLGKEQRQGSTNQESFQSGLNGVDGELVEFAIGFKNLLGGIGEDVFGDSEA